ncbi:hypothetical protein C8R43DRAFT_959987 [Mycena crocata]|nr:hypothetical protein C8R43DRAFT_959987 [Mycena crocata]
MYGLSTWDWAAGIHLLRDDLKVFLPADLVQPRAWTPRSCPAPQVCIPVFDSLTIWPIADHTQRYGRLLAHLRRDRCVLVTAAVLLSVLSCGLILCNLTQIGLGFPSVRHLHLLAPSELIVDIITLVLSALVNIWATGMISWQAWYYKFPSCAAKHYLKDTSKRTFAESMLALFAESGAMYTALWIPKNIIVLPVIKDTAYTDYASLIMFQVTGMYPTVIIILVALALRMSHLENQFTSYGAVTTRSQPGDGLIFASVPTDSAAIGPQTRLRAYSARRSPISTELGSKDQGEKEEEEV